MCVQYTPIDGFIVLVVVIIIIKIKSPFFRRGFFFPRHLAFAPRTAYIIFAVYTTDNDDDDDDYVSMYVCVYTGKTCNSISINLP